jgi:hypothetical protein
VEHDEQADRMEREADRMEHESERVGEHIDETRREWESKEQDPAVPGAQPDEDEQEESAPGEEDTATGDPGATGAEHPDE